MMPMPLQVARILRHGSTVHAGSEVVVREEREGWLRIALPSGEQGWIKAEAAEVVEL